MVTVTRNHSRSHSITLTAPRFEYSSWQSTIVSARPCGTSIITHGVPTKIRSRYSDANRSPPLRNLRCAICFFAAQIAAGALAADRGYARLCAVTGALHSCLPLLLTSVTVAHLSALAAAAADDANAYAATVGSSAHAAPSAYLDSVQVM